MGREEKWQEGMAKKTADKTAGEGNAAGSILLLKVVSGFGDFRNVMKWSGGSSVADARVQWNGSDGSTYAIMRLLPMRCHERVLICCF